jgi:carboxyl-terminal processing protease
MRFRTAFVLFGAFSAGFAAHALIGTADAKPAAESPYTAMGQLGRVLALVENEFVDPTDRTKLVNGAIEGMVGNLDPHSAYLPPHDFEELQEDTAGKFAGIGVEVEFRDDAIVILSVIENSPAEKVGLKSGDRIIAVDSQSVKQVGYEKLVRHMRGAPGTHVKLLVTRAGKLEPMSLDVERAEVHMSSIKAAMMPNSVAYVEIKQFQDKTHEEFLRAVGKLRGDDGKTPIAGVLLDLRGNPGGLVDQAAGVADEFLTGGTIYTMRHRGQIVETATAHSGGALADLPLVVLMSEWSASAAELVAGALQDSDHATVVGMPSFGKGVVQEIIDLPNGAGLKLTVSRYYTPNGHGVQGEGIHPDVLVEPKQSLDGGTGAIVFHESDYANSLPSEGSTARDAGITITYDVPDGGTADSLIAHEIPSDPRTSTDVVMKIGYETLLRKMKAEKK